MPVVHALVGRLPSTLLVFAVHGWHERQNLKVFNLMISNVYLLAVKICEVFSKLYESDLLSIYNVVTVL